MPQGSGEFEQRVLVAIVGRTGRTVSRAAVYT